MMPCGILSCWRVSIRNARRGIRHWRRWWNEIRRHHHDRRYCYDLASIADWMTLFAHSRPCRAFALRSQIFLVEHNTKDDKIIEPINASLDEVAKTIGKPITKKFNNNKMLVPAPGSNPITPGQEVFGILACAFHFQNGFIHGVG